MRLDVPDLTALQARRSEKWSRHGAGVLASTTAEMDFALAPPVAEALRAAIDRHDLGYAPPTPRRLAEAFAGFAARRLGWTVDPEQVTLVPDVMAGIVELSRVLAAPGQTVAFATPAYPPFYTDLPQARVRLREVPLRPDHTLDANSLEVTLRAGARVVVLANPHNPTGHVLSRAELERIAETCAAHDAWVLADEIHAPLVLDGAMHTPWLDVADAARERGIALTSASKAFNVAGLKAAVAVTASATAREAMARLPELADRAGLLGVVAAEAAFRDGDEWLDEVLAQLTANRALLGERLARDLPDVRWTPPAGTYLAWLDCRGLGLGDEPAATFLERGRVALMRGLDFGPAGAGHVRLNFGTSPELVEEMVRRMATAL